MTAICRVISEGFRRVLDEEALTVTAASRLLGVSRQAFHGYIAGTAMPRPRILDRAVELWPSRITVANRPLDKTDFPANRGPVPVPTQLELDLGRRIDAISEKDLHVVLTRDGMTMKVAVSIDIPAA